MSIDCLIQKCQNNDAKAQNMLFEFLYKKMRPICYRYVKSKQVAEDVLQNSFLDIFLKLKDFRHEGSFEGWVKRIVTFHAIAGFRREIKGSEHIDDISQLTYDPSGFKHIEEDIFAKEIKDIIKTLPTNHKSVLYLFSIQGYSHVEIGQILNINSTTSRSHLLRAKKALKTQI